MGGGGNRRRALADLVSLEAWHKAFSGRSKVAALHVDVVFSTARLGAEADAPLRFQLSVKNAEVVVVIPPHEPVRVDPDSVERGKPTSIGTVKRTRRAATSGGLVGSLGAAVGAKPRGVAAGGAAAGASFANTTEVELTAEVRAISVQHSLTSKGEHRWALAPVLGKTLNGSPWDSRALSMLKLVKTSAGRLSPGVRVEVRCRREDLLIEKIVVADPTLWRRLKGTPEYENKMIAANSYIRDRLVQAGLVAGESDSPYATLTIAAVAAEEVEA